MNVLITGANGFVGRALVRKLLDETPLTRLDLVDIGFDQPPQDGRIRHIAGSIADASVLAGLWHTPYDLVFHLASIPGGAAERNFELGLAVNLQASIALLEGLRRQEKPARLVFASTVAVYGSPLPPHVGDETPAAPKLSYGAHKLAVEGLIEDYSRRGWVDGVSLRLPGIVARPPGASGLLSAFMSDVFWHLKEGREFACPVSPDATAWWMSVECCARNLLHAAGMPARALAQQRSFLLPVLHLSMEAVIGGLAAAFGEDRRRLVRFEPQPGLEAAFGAQPPLRAVSATAAGFRHDGSVADLIVNAVKPIF